MTPILAKVTNDNDGSVYGHGVGSPLLGTHDHPNRSRNIWGKVVLLLLVLLGITGLIIALAQQTNLLHNAEPELRNLPDIVESELGVVTCDDARCSKVGALVLKQGGHAVDAAIATCLCLGVVNPTESGIGGGAFMVVLNASTSEAVAFDMRETAPAAAFENMYENDTDAQTEGPLSIAVPGELAGLYAAWKIYGRMPWRTLFQPAINYAKNGFEIYPYLSIYVQQFEKEIMNDTGKRQVFAPHGQILKKGETCYNKRLAETLEAVAEQGPDAFYKGSVAEKFVGDVRAKGGILTMEDLSNYEVNVTEVLEIDIMGYKLLGMLPPSSGTVGLAMVANVLRNYGSPDELKGSLGLHRLTEAIKHMFAIRTNLGDPAYDDVSEYINKMTSPSFGEEIWRKINDNTTFPPEYYLKRWSQPQHHGTSHMGVVDAERNAVALTASINDHFGGKMMSASTGILINNQMGDFSIPTVIPGSRLPPPPANRIRPGKRPLSSMTPLIILKDGQLAGVIGGSGGRNIIAAVTQVFLNHFFLGKDPLAAIQSPRIYPKLVLNELDYENMTVINGNQIVLPKENQIFLEERGHNLTVIGFPAVCHLIVQNYASEIDLGRKNGRKSVGDVKFGTLTAVSDLRKDAKPAAV